MKNFIHKIIGIKIKKNKISRNVSIKNAGIPNFVCISTDSHIGAPAKIVVNVGGLVKVGTIIAKAEGDVSANVYSSVSGKVVKINEHSVVIETSGDVFDKKIKTDSELIKNIPEDKEEILEKIRNAGIIGMGGAGFPTAVKLNLPEDKKIECLIINGMECEPYLTADNRLLIEKAEEIIIGARIINKILGIQNAIIAIDESNKEALKVMTSISKRYIGVNIKGLKNLYPQGAERQLIKAISGKEIISSKLPMDVGFIIQNAATTFAIYEAVMKDMPLFQRVVTISGDAILEPQNFLVRNGTSISYLLEKAGLDKDTVKTVILNGQMMGTTVQDLDMSISLVNAGVLALKSSKSNVDESACIRCNRCAQNCPVRLQPFAIASNLKTNDTPRLYKLRAFDCIGCGICSYVCPAKIPLLDLVKMAKEETK